MESLTVSSFQNLSSTIVSPIEDYSDNDLHLYRSEPHITVVDGETRIQDLPPPPDLTSDILLQNEINYQKQKANAQGKGVRLQVEEDEDDNPSRVSTKIQQLLNTLKVGNICNYIYFENMILSNFQWLFYFLFFNFHRDLKRNQWNSFSKIRMMVLKVFIILILSHCLHF